jgi:uncharacterized membrane protein
MMVVRINRIHRFLVGQMMYPILLSTILALVLFVGRVYMSGSWRIYSNLVWNLFLAWIPYLFSISAASLQRLVPRAGLLLVVPGVLWLVFFPNAPYIVTDFLHLEQRPYVPLLYDILLLASFSWTGLFLAIASLRTMQVLVKIYLGNLISWFFVAIALGFSGLGIYLGRFERWNTWDLVFHFDTILKSTASRMLNPMDNLRFIGFTVLFTAFLLVCYLTFISVHKVEMLED